MKRETLSDALSAINSRYIQEAADPKRSGGFFRRPLSKVVIAAGLTLCLLVGGLGLFSPGGITVTAHAQGTDQEITSAGVILSTGRISDSGEMRGKPLFFYLSGRDIDSVRFSCKNQQIRFTDWTEQREEFGLAQNFTVPYGEDESVYYYLLIDWEPTATIRALTGDAGATIQTLPTELREDVIVMEITFTDGRTDTKAVTVSLLGDGTFFAAFGDYQITEQDSFVRRPDSPAIPREDLYNP